jgi:hypothetical protein
MPHSEPFGLFLLPGQMEPADGPCHVLGNLAEIWLMDIVRTIRDRRRLRECCVSHPTDHRQVLLDHLSKSRSLHANGLRQLSGTLDSGSSSTGMVAGQGAVAPFRGSSLLP